jgi:hypothetical protein
MNSVDEFPSQQAYEYVESLLQARCGALGILTSKHSRQLIPSDEYLRDRRSLLSALAQIEMILSHERERLLSRTRIGIVK